MKRVRDGNQQQEERQEIPPPPPRTRPPASKNSTQQQQEIPPPPPPRTRPPPRNDVAAANGFSIHAAAAAASVSNAVAAWSGTNGTPKPNGGVVGGNRANVFSGSSPSISSPSSVTSSAAPKRAKLGVGQLDEIVLKAGIGGGIKGQVSDARGATNGGGNKKHPGNRTAARSKRRFAVVCSANFNRSMMAHELLQEHNFQVESYGTSK